MKKTFSLLLVFAIALCALVAAQAESVSLNDATLDEIIAKAQEIGDIQSVGMPDDWANWGETWGDILETYGITHSDIDMSSGEELALEKTRIQMRMAAVAARMSAPKKGDSPEKLNEEYQELIKKLNSLK